MEEIEEIMEEEEKYNFTSINQIVDTIIDTIWKNISLSIRNFDILFDNMGYIHLSSENGFSFNFYSSLLESKEDREYVFNKLENTLKRWIREFDGRVLSFPPNRLHWTH